MNAEDDEDGTDGHNKILQGQEIVEEMIQEETTGEVSAMPNGQKADEETCSIQTNLETAEADSLRTSEQEEKKTFIITGNNDPLSCY